MGMLALSYWILPLLLLDRHNPIARSLVVASPLIIAVGLTSAVATLGSDIDIRRLRGWYGVVVTIGALAVAGPRCWQDDELTMNDAFLDRDRIALITASLATIRRCSSVHGSSGSHRISSSRVSERPSWCHSLPSV